MATPGLIATQRKKGINSTTWLLSQQKQTILQKFIVGPNALPYQPFKRQRGGEDDPTVRELRDDAVDYNVARSQEWNRLSRKAGGGLRGVFASQSDVRPVLISEREMARMNQRYNPSLALIYTTEGPMQERHPDDQILRNAGKTAQPSREKDLGATGMAK